MFNRANTFTEKAREDRITAAIARLGADVPVAVAPPAEAPPGGAERRRRHALNASAAWLGYAIRARDSERLAPSNPRKDSDARTDAHDHTLIAVAARWRSAAGGSLAGCGDDDGEDAPRRSPSPSHRSHRAEQDEEGARVPGDGQGRARDDDAEELRQHPALSRDHAARRGPHGRRGHRGIVNSDEGDADPVLDRRTAAESQPSSPARRRASRRCWRPAGTRSGRRERGRRREGNLRRLGAKGEFTVTGRGVRCRAARSAGDPHGDRRRRGRVRLRVRRA